MLWHRRFYGDTVTPRGYVPVKTRCQTRKALERGRYMRPTLIANLRRPARRAGKVDKVSRGLCPPAVTHLVITPSEHPFDPEPALRPLLKLTSTRRCSVAGFGCLSCRWWLQLLGEQRHRRRLVGTLAIMNLVAAVLAGPPLGRSEAAERRSCGLDCIGGHCSLRMLLPSASGSCARQAEAFGTLGGLILTCAARGKKKVREAMSRHTAR